MITSEQGSRMRKHKLLIAGKKLFPLEHYRDDSHYPHGKAERLTWRAHKTELSGEHFGEMPRALEFTLPELAGDELEAT